MAIVNGYSWVKCNFVVSIAVHIHTYVIVISIIMLLCY